MKLYVSIVDFQLHLPKTLLNAKIVYILNVDFDEWNNIGIHDFFHSIPSRVPKPLRSYEFFENLKFSGSNFSKRKVDHYTKCRT